MTSFHFACCVESPLEAHQANLLHQSLRTFGGEHSAAEFSCWIPEYVASYAIQPVLNADIQQHTFQLESVCQPIPFTAKAIASAHMEAQLQGKVDLLVWMDVGAVILQPPAALQLPQDKIIGYRPVDHTLIGSPFDEVADAFWSQIYHDCGVSPEQIFPMQTSVDERILRPYFNAGMLVVRPQEHILQMWAATLTRLLKGGAYVSFFDQDRLYAIFIHQAVLSGVILAKIGRDEMFLLLHQVNYPLHMHHDYPAERRATSLDELVSLRYEQFFDDPNWEVSIPCSPRLRAWFDANLSGNGF